VSLAVAPVAKKSKKLPAATIQPSTFASAVARQQEAAANAANEVAIMVQKAIADAKAKRAK